jgi:hypothetical protein
MKYKQVMESLAQPTTIDKAMEAAYSHCQHHLPPIVDEFLLSVHLTSI